MLDTVLGSGDTLFIRTKLLPLQDLVCIQRRDQTNTAQISPILNRSPLGIIQEKADVEGMQRKFAHWEVKR